MDSHLASMSVESSGSPVQFRQTTSRAATSTMVLTVVETKPCEVSGVHEAHERCVCSGRDAAVQIALGRDGVVRAVELGAGDVGGTAYVDEIDTPAVQNVGVRSE